MILGFSHITLSSTNFKEDERELKKLGYFKRFEETDLVNSRAKYPFLKFHSKRMAMAFFESKKNPSVELIQYDRFVEGVASPFQVLFNGAAQRTKKIGSLEYGKDRIRRSISNVYKSDEIGFQTLGTSQLTCPVILKGVNYSPNIFFRLVPDIRVATHFWKEFFGIKKPEEGSTAAGQRFARLKFAGSMPHWSFTMILLEAKEKYSLPMLDHLGFSCMSILTSNLERARKKFFAAGGEFRSAPIDIKVNDRDLKLEIVRTPDGALLELLAIQLGRPRA